MRILNGLTKFTFVRGSVLRCFTALVDFCNEKNGINIPRFKHFNFFLQSQAGGVK